jgi:hypothetical protein
LAPQKKPFYQKNSRPPTRGKEPFSLAFPAFFKKSLSFERIAARGLKKLFQQYVFSSLGWSITGGMGFFRVVARWQ